MEQEARRVLEAFRARYSYDRGLKRLKSVDHYQRMFPSFEDVIAQEYARLESERASTSTPAPVAVAATPAAPPGAAERRVGPYRIERELGRGGQAVVYLAEDTRLPRRVALKVFAAGLLPSEPFLARFRREVEAAARLDHPGICTVYEAGVDGDTPYIAMRYVEGRTLAEWIDASLEQAAGGGRTSSLELPAAPASSPSERPSVVLRVVALVEKAARALHVAHEAGLVHRDVKPGNIIVTREGEPVLLDFGLAREDDGGQTLTLTGALLGTPAYMSPEQLLATRIRLDCRTDVYSLGVTLYECLTLRRPFDAPTREGLYQQILTSEADSPRRLNPLVSRELEIVLATAMEKDRDRRYRTALEFAEDLRRLREHEPIHARRTPVLLRLGRWTQRHPALATAIGASFALLAVAFGFTAWFLAESRDEQKRTAQALDDRTLALREAEDATRRAEAETQAKAEALDEATRAERHARSLALGGASADALASDPMRAALLAREAVRLDPTPAAFNHLRFALFSCVGCVELRGHAAQLNSALFSPNGDRVLTASSDGTAKIWDLAGKQIAVLTGHEAPVTTAAYSPDGSLIATGAKDRTVRLWDSSGTPLRVLQGHFDQINDIAFSPRGDRLVTASFDRTVRVWNVDGRQTAIVTLHDGRPCTVAFSPQGDSILIASDDKTARLCDLDGNERAICRGHEHWVGRAAFSPKGDRIVTVSEDTTARLWDLSGTCLATLRGHTGAVIWAAFSPQGDRVVTASRDGTARVWNLAGDELAVLKGHMWGQVNSAEFSPQGDRIVTAADDYSVRVWDPYGKELMLLRGHSNVVGGAHFSARGDRIVSWSPDATARVWDVSQKELAVLRGHEGAVKSAQFSPQGNRIVTASDDRTARVWDLTGKELAALRGHAGPVTTARFSPGGDLIVTASADGTACIWDLAGNRRTELQGHQGKIRTAAFSPKGDLIVTASEDMTARVWDVAGKRSTVLSGHTGALNTAAFSPRGDRVATASEDSTARVWSIDGTESWVLQGHKSVVYAAAFSPHGDRIVTTAFDDTPRLWDISGGPLAVLSGHTSWVRTAAFSPQGDRIVTGASDNTARVWDLSGTQVAVLQGHEAWVESVAFSPSGDLVLTSSPDKTARLWDLAGNEVAELRGHRGDVYTAAFSPAGDKVVTASFDGTARVWLVRNEDVLALASERITRDFDRDERARYAQLLGPENKVELEAQRAVDVLVPGMVLVEEAVERVNADASLPDAVRAAAVRILTSTCRDDPAKINEAVWPVVKSPGRTAEEYRLAVRRLEIAAHLVAEDGSVANTLGIAQYRLGRYGDALTTLQISDRINTKAKPPGIVEDVAFLAMCRHRLGQPAEARACLVRLHDLMKDAQRAATPDAANFVKEAEALVAGD